MSEAKKNGTEELEVITPPIMQVDLREEVVTVYRIKTKQLLQIMEIAAPFYEELQKMREDIIEQKANPRAKAMPTSANTYLYKMVLKYGKNIVQLVSVLTDKDEEAVGELEIDELIKVFSSILEVNIDFFTQKVLPELTKLTNDLVMSMKGVNLGQT